ncbi:hypothetical protein [Candidatus Palauibacter sp.]|uniref:hypothetical protein n=1 Tax=Candidatus Palauibacter sp. TaxID=3101350 RepID=UPI003B020282
MAPTLTSPMPLDSVVNDPPWRVMWSIELDVKGSIAMNVMRSDGANMAPNMCIVMGMRVGVIMKPPPGETMSASATGSVPMRLPSMFIVM